MDRNQPGLPQSKPLDDDARRAFWTTMLDQADAFMDEVIAYPLAECGEPMGSLLEAAKASGAEVVFSDQPHSRGLPRQYFLRERMVPGFVAAALEMNARGWVLKVEDAYRSTVMQQGLSLNESIFGAVLAKTKWECGGEKPPVDLLFRRMGSLIANRPKVGTHMSGSALDISVLRRDTGEEVERGGPYPEMSERTPMLSPFVSERARQNREEITDLLGRHGFVTYPWEFWHYNDGDAYAELLKRTGQPARYGPVHMDPVDGSVTPIDDPCAPLNSVAVIRDLMERVLAGW
ncbi:MAG: M15 family metallopeptidase [Armatimonadota bacterium]